MQLATTTVTVTTYTTVQWQSEQLHSDSDYNWRLCAHLPQLVLPHVPVCLRCVDRRRTIVGRRRRLVVVVLEDVQVGVQRARLRLLRVSPVQTHDAVSAVVVCLSNIEQEPCAVCQGQR